MSYDARRTMAATPTQAEVDARMKARRDFGWIVAWTCFIVAALLVGYLMWHGEL